MKATNITIKEESDLVRETKELAARKGALRRLQKGHDMSWEKPAGRDDLHDRKKLRHDK